MSDIISLQNLAGSVRSVEQSMEPTRLSVLYHSNCNNSSLSEYHLRFTQLINKYSGFAEEYRSELNQFHKLLLRTIELKQEKERERLERLEKFEIISNSNLEIVDNECIEYSPAASIKNQDGNNSSSDQQSDAEQESEAQIVTVPIKAKPVSIPAPDPAPVPAPVPIKAKSIKAKSTKPKSTKLKSTKAAKKNNIKKPTKSKSRKNAAKNVKNEVDKKNDIDSKQNDVANMDKAYKYNINNIRWRFNGIKTSSTLIYIGNLPWNLPVQREETQKLYNSKISAIQFFIAKKAKVNMKKIEETQLKHGSRGMYALVRFRSDVPLDLINKFINGINTENAEIAEERKKESNKIGKMKKNKVISWQKRVFLKFNHNFRFYESEDAMYNDPMATETLFIRNFDVLNKKCHYELTHKLLEFGDLCNDIKIGVDFYGDPYCLVTFKFINDAIYCCNSEIDFNGRMLEMRYSKF